jgi:NAD+ diphosphatase
MGLTSPMLGLAFYAQGILNWLHNHRHCSRCGHATEIRQAGFSRQCLNSECGKVSYPKIDPAVIFSVINTSAAEQRILLGRQPTWDPMRYAVIAGFVEPGETLEDAVRREAYEETGLVLESVDYVGSQSWPFPDSLMVGFTATTTQNEIVLADQELEHAAWFSATEIENRLREGSLKMPFPISISRYLIDIWFTAQRGYPLNDIVGWAGDATTSM